MAMEKSKRFAHSREITKLIDRDHVLGYVVLGGGRFGASVRPIYDGQCHVRIRRSAGPAQTHIVSTYEQGEEALNGLHYEDMEGQALAQIALHAIAALTERARRRLAEGVAGPLAAAGPRVGPVRAARPKKAKKG